MSDLSEEEVRRMKRRAKGAAMAAGGVAAIVATGGAAAPLVMAGALAYGMNSMLSNEDSEERATRQSREARERAREREREEELFDEGPSSYAWTGRECTICKVVTSHSRVCPPSLAIALHLLTSVTLSL
jgi:hypothetical protein